MKTISVSFLALLCTLASCARGEAVDAASQSSTPPAAARAPNLVADAPTDAWRRELLQLAFAAASRFPVDPHHKNRGRAQELAVVAAFELNQPKLALSFAPQVQGWRRGAAYADYAWVAARAGAIAESQRYVELAQSVLREQEKDPNGQEWRADQVRLKIARALHAAGDTASAAATASEISPASTTSVDQTWAQTFGSQIATLTPEGARAELERIDQSFDAQSLGDQFTSLTRIGLMQRQFFADTALRAECEERLFERYTKLPPGLRTEAMRPLVDAYLEHQDRDGARQVVDKIAGLVDGFRWRAEDLIPQLAAVAGLRGKLGDVERARQELRDARTRYHQQRDEIVDIYRCETLRSIGLAYSELGDRSDALDVLTLAIEEGLENPNSRPRCDDLVETCVAMAKHCIEPSAELWDRLREIRDGLNDPW